MSKNLGGSVQGLRLKLARIHVDAHVRKSKSGVSANVAAYFRAPGSLSDSDLLDSIGELTALAKRRGVEGTRARNQLTAVRFEIDKRGLPLKPEPKKVAKTRMTKARKANVEALKEKVAQRRAPQGPRESGEDITDYSEAFQPNPERAGRVTPSARKRLDGLFAREASARPRRGEAPPPLKAPPSLETRSTAVERQRAKESAVREMSAQFGIEEAEAEKNLAWMDMMTPEEAENRRARLSVILSDLPDTAAVFGGVDKDGNLSSNGDFWSASRSAIHAQLIEDYKADVGWDSIPADRKAILSGGLGGAGKGFTLKRLGIDHKEYITIDPDDLKGRMAEMGLVPNPEEIADLEGWVPPVTLMELAGLIHEESSYLSTVISEMARAEGKNVILDNTMGSDKIGKKVTDLRDVGYNIDGVFVDVSIDWSISSAQSRHLNGLAAAASGQSEFGGRFVDPKLQRGSDPESPAFRSRNRERFNNIEGLLDNSMVVENEGFVGRPTTIPEGVWASLSDSQRSYILRMLKAGAPTQQILRYVSSADESEIDGALAELDAKRK